MSHPPHFETQNLDEEVLIFARAHLFTNVGWVFLVLIFISLPPLLKLISVGDNTPLNFNLSLGTQLILTLAWYLFVAAFTFQRFLLWFFNIYIVTNKRVVDIDFVNLFYKQISSTTISNIQDVRHRRGGVAQLIFNYGDVFIQTAGATEHFDFHAIPEPNLVQKRLVKLIHESRKPWGGIRHEPRV